MGCTKGKPVSLNAGGNGGADRDLESTMNRLFLSLMFVEWPEQKLGLQFP